MGTAVRPAKTSPGPWDALDDVDAFVDEVLAELEAMAHEMLERLPAGFRKMCEGVIVRVEDFPTGEVLDARKIKLMTDVFVTGMEIR